MVDRYAVCIKKPEEGVFFSHKTIKFSGFCTGKERSSVKNSIRDARTPQPREIFSTYIYIHIYIYIALISENLFISALAVILTELIFIYVQRM